MKTNNHSNQITTNLPPMFQQLSSFEFGKLIIELNIEQLQQLDIEKFQFVFLCANLTKKTFEFPIRTTLWHFYQYLKDMQSIKINLQTSSRANNQLLVCQKTIQLLPVTKVMNKNYTKGNYIANSVELCDIFCQQNKDNRGYVMFKVKLDFYEDLHMKVREVVDFGQIMTNPQENLYQEEERYSQNQQTQKNPFFQLNSLQSRKNKQSQLLIDSKQVRPQQQNQQNPYTNIIKNIQNIQMASNLQQFPTIQYSQVKHLQQDESKMIEDDIDRLIQEMQNKPYDSSRYLDNVNSNQQGGRRNNFVGASQFVSPGNQANYMMNMMNAQQVPQGSYYQNSFQSVNSIPVDSRMNRFQQDTFLPNQTHQSNRSQHNNSRSPINNNNRKYPPIPLPNNNFQYNNHNEMSQQQQFMPNQTILSHTQRSVSPMNSRSNRSLNRTQQSPYMHNQSMKNNSYHTNNNNNSMAMSGSNMGMTNNNQNTGTLKIQIHELLGKELQLNDCVLRVYANNQVQEIINCKGYQQGEVIAYNQKAELSDTQLCDIEKLRFQLQNYSGVILYSAVFEMTRLITIPRLQGIFMLNLIPHNQQFYGNQLTASQTIIKKIQKPPTPKNLRITLSFTQQLQVIQMYMNLSKFSLNFTKCKYKIPLTKQTVEFEPTETHFNIFPHSKAYPKLMIEFWDDKAIMGLCEIGLAQLKSITKNVLECNLQPIYLYDAMMPIKNIFTQNQVGKFKLLVCCGNVRQVQHVLNKTMLSRTSSLTQMSQSTMSNKTPVQVEYDKKLGVYIKERKQNNEIEIQVDEGELRRNLGQKQVYYKNFQRHTKNNEDGDHEVSMLSENEFLASDNEAKGDIAFSKVHSTKLSQQEIQDDDEEENVVKQTTQKLSPQFQKKKSSSITQPQPKPSKSKSITSKQPSPPLPTPVSKPLSSLQSIISTKIKSTLSPLCSSNFLPFQQLKKACKPNLLFNFIDIDILIRHMMQLGLNKLSISSILQVLQPLNGMVNFNLLNDFMMCLQVEGEVKYNLVPNKLFVRMALDEYYRLACEDVQRQQEEYDRAYESDEKQWLSTKYLQQISTLDQSIDFSQNKKLFTTLGIKISMNEYTSLKNFLQNQKDIRAFLFEMAESKASYEQMIKSQKNLFQVVKLCVIEGLVNRKKEHELNVKYQESILDKLYSSKMFQDRLNHSVVSYQMHKGQGSELRESRASQCYQHRAQFVETKKNYLPSVKNKQQHSFIERDNNDSFMQGNSTNKHQSNLEQNDDDDFIINGLNAKPQPKPTNSYQQTQKNYNKKPQKYLQQQDSDSQPQQIINSHKYKQPAPQLSFSNTGQTVINYNTKRTITLSGLEDCKETCECQLDMELQLPYIKVQIETPYEKKIYFKESDSSHTQSFDIRGGDVNDDDEIQGIVTLSDVTKKGEIEIAAARFVVIKGIQSVYALKTLREDTFCGLLKIVIE